MKVAIYCRLSEEDKDKRHVTDDSESIQNQKSMLIQYATEQGWEIYGIYSDDDYTGADRSRPEFNRLLEDAKHKKFDIVLCKTQSRFTRELELVEKYIHGYFPIWGIRFVSIVDNADTENKGNKKSRQINGLVNEWYLEDMSENIKSVLTDKRKNGYHIGAFALYGYQKEPKKKGKNIYWMHTIPFWSGAVQEALAFNENAQIAGCELSRTFEPDFDPEDPYDAMARRMVYHGLNGSAVRRIEAGIRHAKDVKADGAVWFGHWGCKHTLGAAQLAKKKFEEAGIPMLLLDGDGCDRSHGGEGQTSTRLGAFLEMLGAEEMEGGQDE